MIWPVPRIWIAGAVVIALSVSHGWVLGKGYAWGKRTEAAANAAARDALTEQLAEVSRAARVAAVEISDYREAQRKLANDLEDEARADVAAPSRVPSADSLRRLKSRWGDGPAR